jgi:hypothetical protein
MKYSLNIQGETVTITGTSIDDVLRKTKRYLEGININYNERSLVQAIKNANVKGKHLTIYDVVSGAKAAINYFTGKAASNEEILRRASICQGCSLISSVSDCMGCGGSGRLAKITNDIRAAKGKEVAIPSSIRDKYCSVCQCSLSLMTVTQYEHISPESEEKQSQRPDHCWLKKTSINFTKQ